jgi:hypothetical protein
VWEAVTKIGGRQHVLPKRRYSIIVYLSMSYILFSILLSSSNIIRVIKSRRMRWVGHVARMGENRGACRILVGRPEGRGPLGRPRRRWEGNIKIDLQEVGWEHGLD